MVPGTYQLGRDFEEEKPWGARGELARMSTAELQAF